MEMTGRSKVTAHRSAVAPINILTRLGWRPGLVWAPRASQKLVAPMVRESQMRLNVSSIAYQQNADPEAGNLLGWA